MTTETLWRHVHAALDERRDPLADEAVLAELELHPGALDEVMDLVQGLGSLRSRSRVGWVAAACAAGLLLTLALWSLRSVLPALPTEVATGEPPQALAPHTPAASRSRVISYRVSVDHTSARGRTTSTSAGRAGEFTRQARFELQPPAPRSYAPLPLTTVIVRNLTRNQP